MQQHTAAVTVIGMGVLASGTSFYLVSSQNEPGRSHVVEQQPSRLVCDCKGFTYRGKCAHVAAVVAHKQKLELARAHAEAIIAEDRISRGMSANDAQPTTSAKAPAHGRWYGGRSQEPFSFLRR